MFYAYLKNKNSIQLEKEISYREHNKGAERCPVRAKQKAMPGN